MSNIELNNLSKKYGAVSAVNNINLSINPGEFVTLLGPSGCGKTTTLRMVAGFIRPTSGNLIIGGTNMIGVPPHRRKVGLVFQNYALFPHMSVKKNIEFGLKMQKDSLIDMTKKVTEILEVVKLSELSDRMPSELSGGQQQRVALARALVIKPEVLLLDEPFGALDKKLRDHMRVELRNLQKKLNISTLFVTHDQDEALSMSDRIVVMNEGKICQIGTPTEIYEKPSSVFVASFMGLSNILTGKCVKVSKDKAIVETEGVLLEVERHELKPNDNVSVMIRPENIGITQGESGSRKVGYLGKILSKIYLGSVVQYTVKLNNGPKILINGNNSKITNHQSFLVDHEVLLSLPSDAIYPIMD